MSILAARSDRAADWGVLLLRLVVGVVMLVAGWIKLFNFGVAGFAKALAMQGVPIPDVAAWGVTLLEVVGGACLVAGLLARVFALLLTIDMIVAIALVTSKIGFLSPTGKAGMEVNILLIAGFLAILLGGPGRLSLDAAFGGWRARRLQPAASP